MVRTSVLTLAVITVPGVLAFWRMECRGVTGFARIDPMMAPGEPSHHMHAFVGSGGMTESASNADLAASSCTSCLVTQDKSAYWQPALYFFDTTTNLYELVQPVGGMLAYYKLNTDDAGTKITAFPANFRMIAGDNTRRTFTAGNVTMADPEKSIWAAQNQTGQDKLAQRAIGFNCLNYGKNGEPALYRHFLPDKRYLDAHCPHGVRFELMFPSCWNGVDLDSPNHRDHVAYPNLLDEGSCPSNFPKRLPGLFYETIWNTPAFKGRTGKFVIANGDKQGFAYHGDFMSGWDQAFLQKAVDTCTNNSGRIQDCPIFDIQSESKAQSCKIAKPAIVANDIVSGPASILPGGRTTFGEEMDVTLFPTYTSNNFLPVKATVAAHHRVGVDSVDATPAGADAIPVNTKAVPVPAATAAPSLVADVRSSSPGQNPPLPTVTKMATLQAAEDDAQSSMPNRWHLGRHGRRDEQ
ncbi:hypothetical protein SEPCBS119000_000571 [Sporothrix epigloea]|uniref:DUF1996 domain-containing protein n=1 Tax=Sporothrix epigloea TaxID=1892477 RepID=A0ABP0D900_9PEZI